MCVCVCVCKQLNKKMCCFITNKMSLVYEITDEAQFKECISNNFSSIICLDFYAVWCGPCKAIAPWVKKYCAQHNIVLAKIDVEKVPSVAKTYGVTCMPTFVFQHNGKSLEKVEGASKKALTKFAEKYCSF